MIEVGGMVTCKSLVGDCLQIKRCLNTLDFSTRCVHVAFVWIFFWHHYQVSALILYIDQVELVVDSLRVLARF